MMFLSSRTRTAFSCQVSWARWFFFFFQAEDGIRDFCLSRGLGDVYKRQTLDSPTMGLTTWKGAPDGKILKSDTLVAKNYLNEKELSRLNRLVTMFIDYAELMAEDEQLMSMQDWLDETDRFLNNNRRKVLDGKGRISREAAEKKVGAIYNEFRKKQDLEYISEFDRQTEKYLKGE